MEQIVLEIARMEAERDAFMTAANAQLQVYSRLIERWRTMLPAPVITTGEVEAPPEERKDENHA